MMIVGRDKWFSIHMPDINTIRTRWKRESREIIVRTLFGKRITNTNRECLWIALLITHLTVGKIRS